jgi:hypothetical protein
MILPYMWSEWKQQLLYLRVCPLGSADEASAAAGAKAIELSDLP